MRQRAGAEAVANKHESAPSPGETQPPVRRPRTTVQQTVYLHPAVYEQLRELAFYRRVKMHDLLMRGLDMVFREEGAKSMAELRGDAEK
jgi:hypothetical protein